MSSHITTSEVRAGADGTTDPSRPVWAELMLLGGFELRAERRTLTLPPAAQRLLAYLALSPRPVSRSRVVADLWLDTTETKALARLRSTLWRVPRVSGRSLVETTASHLRLADTVTVDLREREEQAEHLLDGDGHCDGLDPAQLSHDVLPDWYDDWALVARERFRQTRLHALESLCERLTVTGRYAAAIHAGLLVVAEEPLRESAHRRVMEAHLAEGNVNEARRQYALCCRLLHHELGVEPSVTLRRLVAPPRLSESA